MINKTTRLAASAAALLIATTGMAAAAPAKPVKIFILSGQSNMTGRGGLGDFKKPAADQKATLVRFIMATENVEKYKFLYNGRQKDKAGWTVRDDVFITVGDWPHDAKTGGKHGGLAPNYGGFHSAGFGPELGIGHALGDFYDEPVLLVKVALGGCSLAVDMRPPSSGGKLGEKYPLIVKAVTEAIEHLPEIIPGYDRRKCHPNLLRLRQRIRLVQERLCAGTAEAQARLPARGGETRPQGGHALRATHGRGIPRRRPVD